MKFAVITTPRSTGAEWAEQARRLEGSGWHALLMPDAGTLPSTFPALAAAAAVTTTLRLRSWVLAVPLRSTPAVVRETAALQLLSDGRFELGLGTGRPGAQQDAERLGLPWPGGAARRQQLLDVVAAVQTEVSPAPPIVITASGEKMIAAGAPIVDRLGLIVSARASNDDLDAAVRRVRAASATVALSLQPVGVGGRIPAYFARPGLDGHALLAAGAVGMLPADPGAAYDVLTEREERWGIDETVVSEDLADDLAPIIGRFA